MKQEILLDVLKKARNYSIDFADIVLTEQESISVNSRLTKIEKIEQSTIISVNLRLFKDSRSVSVSTDNMDVLVTDDFLENALSALQFANKEECECVPDKNELCYEVKKIDIFDDSEISIDQLISSAKKCESYALENTGITNSEGACAEYNKVLVAVANTNNFCKTYRKSIHGLSLVTLAQNENSLERDYAFANTIYYGDLKSEKILASEAVDRTLAKLNARKIKSCKVPVIFDKRISSQLLMDFVSALNGSNIARNISFLCDKLDKKIFNHNLCIIDDACKDRALASRPFDMEGLECKCTDVVENGVIRSFFLNTKYANMLHMKSTAHAGANNTISTNNVYIKNGADSLNDIIKNISRGLYVTEVLGNGLNLVTGNYSQGAVGFWIENGEIAYPVNEITLAGNFIEMFNYCCFANDLSFDYKINAPSMCVENIVVGGI